MRRELTDGSEKMLTTQGGMSTPAAFARRAWSIVTTTSRSAVFFATRSTHWSTCPRIPTRPSSGWAKSDDPPPITKMIKRVSGFVAGLRCNKGISFFELTLPHRVTSGAMHLTRRQRVRTVTGQAQADANRRSESVFFSCSQKGRCVSNPTSYR